MNGAMVVLRTKEESENNFSLRKVAVSGPWYVNGSVGVDEGFEEAEEGGEVVEVAAVVELGRVKRRSSPTELGAYLVDMKRADSEPAKQVPSGLCAVCRPRLRARR